MRWLYLQTLQWMWRLTTSPLWRRERLCSWHAPVMLILLPTATSGMTTVALCCSEDTHTPCQMCPDTQTHSTALPLTQKDVASQARCCSMSCVSKQSKSSFDKKQWLLVPHELQPRIFLLCPHRPSWDQDWICVLLSWGHGDLCVHCRVQAFQYDPVFASWQAPGKHSVGETRLCCRWDSAGRFWTRWVCALCGKQHSGPFQSHTPYICQQ